MLRGMRIVGQIRYRFDLRVGVSNMSGWARGGEGGEGKGSRGAGVGEGDNHRGLFHGLFTVARRREGG